MEEQDLVVAAANGDKEAFIELYKKYRDMVHRHCYAATLNPEEAQDLFQEIWLKVYVGMRRIREVRSFGGYLKAILRNTIIDYVRRLSQYEEIDPELPGKQEDPLLALSVREILKGLSPENRYLLFLRFYEERTTREIALMLGLSESAVKMRLHRLLKRLGANREKRRI